MLTESALVEAVDGQTAWVSTQRRSACGGCDARSACGSGTLSKVFGGKGSRLKVRNPIAARPGDRVTVAIGERALVRGAVVMYLIPLLLFFLFAALAQVIAGEYREPVTVLASLAGLLLGLRLVKRHAAMHARDPVYQAVITAIEQAPAAGGLPVYFK